MSMDYEQLEAKCQMLEAKNRRLKEAAQHDYAEGFEAGADSVIDKLHWAHKLIGAIHERVRTPGDPVDRLGEIRRLLVDYETEQEESLKVLEGK